MRRVACRFCYGRECGDSGSAEPLTSRNEQVSEGGDLAVPKAAYHNTTYCIGSTLLWVFN